MSTELFSLRARMARCRARFGVIPPARILVHHVDDWRTICLLGGIEPNAHQALEGGLCGSFEGIPVLEAPAIARPGQAVLLKGAEAREHAGWKLRHQMLGTPRVFELNWEVIR